MTKLVLNFVIIASLTACTTTTTKNLDGSTTTIRTQDPKIIKAITSGAAEGATRAAIEALQNQ